MTKPRELARARFGDMTALWYEHVGRTIMFALAPTARLRDFADHREYLSIDDAAHKGNAMLSKATHGGHAIQPESCLQLKYALPAGQPSEGGSFTPGLTCRNTRCNGRMAFQSLDIAPDGSGAVLCFRDAANGLEARQAYTYSAGDKWIVVNTTVANTGDAPVTLDYLASFSLGMLSPFQPDAGADCYSVMQWHAAWSGEGRLEERAIEEAGLEQSWNSFGVRLSRIASASSRPVCNYFPQMGFADNKAGVVWGASLEAFGPWQMQLFRIGDSLCLDGGLPDRTCNGWRKTLQPGESLAGIPAAVTCASVAAGETAAETLCNRLAPFCGTTPENIPPADADVPALFNDWCKTWGKPYRDNLRPVVQTLKDSGVAYLNMDFGWFQSSDFCSAVPEGVHNPDIGDWLPYPAGEKYPDGFAAWCAEIRQAGLIPGVWFEFEAAVKSSVVFKEHPDWFLTRDGLPINDGLRFFPDFRRPEVVAFYRERVINFLRSNKIGYMKVDYNGHLEGACDGPAASQAENFRVALEAAVGFYRLIRRELPELTLEICASGGQRASAGWMRLGSLASTSDAHEGVEIPLVAADTAMLVAARNNQIWATLHDWDDENRLLYSLAAGCIGRLCLSGDVDKLSAPQLSLMKAALAYYDACKPLVKDGDSLLRRQLKSRSYITPKGSQLYMRRVADGRRLAAVLHNFGEGDPATRWIVPGQWRLQEGAPRLMPTGAAAAAEALPDGTTALSFAGMPAFSAAAVFLVHI